MGRMEEKSSSAREDAEMAAEGQDWPFPQAFPGLQKTFGHGGGDSPDGGLTGRKTRLVQRVLPSLPPQDAGPCACPQVLWAPACRHDGGTPSPRAPWGSQPHALLLPAPEHMRCENLHPPKPYFLLLAALFV